MNLGQLLAEEIINEGKKVVALMGGGFKIPTKGHFSVITQTLDKYPNIDEFIIYVGSGVRDGISQAESVLIWEIYKKYLPSKVKFIPTSSPVKAIYDYSKEHPDELVKWILGSREGKEDDFEEFKKRTAHLSKYPNLEAINMVTTGEVVSGTKARLAAKANKEEFYKYLPQELTPEEKEEIYNITSNVIIENEVKETTFVGRLGLKWDKFLDALKNEKKETQEAFDLLLKSSKGEIELSSEQKKQIGEQLKSTFRSIGFIGLLALPGGTIFLLLLKFLKLNKFVTPNSFKKEAIQEKTNPEGFELEGEMDFKGLHIMIENKKGSIRSGVSEEGKKWETKMIYPYGYISKTKAADNEHVDCFVGDNHDSDVVFVVHQVVPETGKYDEDKVMLGFDTAEEAKNGYLIHYDSPDFFGSMTEMTFDRFVESLKENRGKRLQEGMIANKQPIDPKSFLKEILDYCCAELNIPKPEVVLLNKLDFTQENNSFGSYIPDENKIFVVIKGRNLSDCARTLSHETKHAEQNYNNRLTDNAGEDGDIFEQEANQFSGIVMRHFNRKYPQILITIIK